MIQYRCEKCGADLESPASMAGKMDSCPACGQASLVPTRRRARWPFVLAGAAGCVVLGIAGTLYFLGGQRGLLPAFLSDGGSSQSLVPTPTNRATTRAREGVWEQAQALQQTEAATTRAHEGGDAWINTDPIVKPATTRAHEGGSKSYTLDEVTAVPTTRAHEGASTRPIATTQRSPVSAREIAKSVTPSVVMLVMEDSQGQPVTMGSGCIVQDGVVATNLHVIEGASRGYAKLSSDKTKYDITGTLAIDGLHDLALLSVEKIKAVPLSIGDSKKVAVGDEVYAVGNPRGLEGTFSAGIVSSIRAVGDDYLLQITAPISPGSSGGPVVNAKGEVVGISVATYKGGQNLNFAIPSSYLASLMGSPTKLAKFVGQTEAKPKGKSILEGTGGKSTDGVEGSDLLWQTPGNQFMGDYSFTLRSKLRQTVKNIVCLVVFRNSKGEALDIDLVTYTGIVPPGLAKRVNSKVDGSVKILTSGNAETPKTTTEFRILQFEIVDSDKADDEEPPKAAPKTDAPVEPQPKPAPRPINGSTSSGKDAQDRLQRSQEDLARAEADLAKAVAKIAPAGDGPDLVESTIDGEFDGWEGETIFKLANGQIWQQATYAYTYHYAFQPKVFIIKTNGAYKMKVDGVSGTIFVKRIK